MLDKLKIPERHYLNNGHSLKSWLLTKDHKRIAIMYLMSISVMFFIGGLFAWASASNWRRRRATSSPPTPTTSSSPCTA